MLDFDKYTEEAFNHIKVWFNIETDPIFSTRFRKILDFVGYKVIPFIMNVASFIILIWILNRISTNYGFERAVIVGIVIIIFSLKGKK